MRRQARVQAAYRNRDPRDQGWLPNLDTMSPVQRKQHFQALNITTRALAVGPADVWRRRLGDPNARAKFADGKAHAAEISPELAIEIEEP